MAVKRRNRIAAAGASVACIGFGAALTSYWWLAWPLAIAASVLMGTAIVMQNREFKRRAREQHERGARWDRELAAALAKGEGPEPPTGIWIKFQDGTREDLVPTFEGMHDGAAVWRVKPVSSAPIASMGADKIPAGAGISWVLPGLTNPWRHP